MTRPPSFRNKSRQFWLACLCALALLGMQSLGQRHRLAHGVGLSGIPAFAPNTGLASPTAFTDVWGHHSGDASCQLFDHLCGGDGLTGETAALALPPPERAVSSPEPTRIDLVAQWKSCARGPPKSA